MTEKDESDPAFPVTLQNVNRGMALRDWFAGQALVGLLSNPNWGPNGAGTAEAKYAGAAYLQADAMLAARSKP